VVDPAGRILFVGAWTDCPTQFKKWRQTRLQGRRVFPAFIECHTHSVFAGERASEFEERLSGISYAEIAARGGGILSTVKNTRRASEGELLRRTQSRVDEFFRQGVATLEIKSGYALDLKNELKLLKVIKKLKGPSIVPTFLGAHALPPEFSSYELYVDYLLTEILPRLRKQKLAQRVDIFIEHGFFDRHLGERYLRQAQTLGFDVVVHANQLAPSGGVDVGVRLGALSVDHVIHVGKSQIEALARSNTVAVLLPLADLYLKCAYPPARKLIDAGVRVALATDFNPGSSPSQDVMLTGLLARLEMGMTLPEVFRAYTTHAAMALNRHRDEGTIEVGKLANFICTDEPLSAFFYSAGRVPEHELFVAGRLASR
jgi:imidazolonepropionase